MVGIRALLLQTGTTSDQLSALRKLYEVGNIANQVADGSVPFPENEQSTRDGICLEFRYFVCYRHSLDADSIFVGMSRSDILEARIMPYATSPSELDLASFAYVHA